jgi:hypothetical protein
MDQFTDPTELPVEDAVSVDKTVTYVIGGLGIVLAFALILSTFVQVNRFTANSGRNEIAPVQPREAEIGGPPRTTTRR